MQCDPFHLKSNEFEERLLQFQIHGVFISTNVSLEIQDSVCCVSPKLLHAINVPNYYCKHVKIKDIVRYIKSGINLVCLGR